jgi:hypothetical protein
MTKNFRHTFNCAPRFFHATTCQGSSQETVIAASEANEPGSVFSQLVLANRSFLFPWSAQLHFGDQTAEILVAGASRDQKRDTKRISDFQFPISGF